MSSNEENILKRIEENTRRTANFLGSFFIITVVGSVMAIVYVLANQ